MRAPWSLIAVLGLVLPVVAVAADNPSVMQTNTRPVGVWASHQGNGAGHGDHDRGDFRHFHRPPFVYVPTFATYAAPSGDDDADRDPSYYTRTEYVPVPYPVPVMPEAPPAPRSPPPIVRYATTGQHIDIPKGAHVTTGSVYKYKQGGVNVYTNVPPPGSADAKLLFGYTEAVAPASSSE
ncbi:MAG TPA: hypothetical protein VGH80_07230 [Xanthomonadaceae bacterium]|jgi:hypothetical protein